MNNNKYKKRAGLLLTAMALLSGSAAAQTKSTPASVPAPAQLRESFLRPPASARPWVYWTWLNSNLTREGITADLEAMNRVGIGGALILDVDQGTPPGPMQFMDSQWQQMFRYTVQEAKRLGMEINMNNGAGYYGSGGAWVTPEMGMQSVVQSEVHVSGGQTWTGKLAKAGPGTDYRDIAVLAVAEPDVPAKDRYKIPDFDMKGLKWYPWVAYRGIKNSPLDATAPAEAVIPRSKVIDLTSKMAADGSLTWAVPAGEWTILRLGHQFNGHVIGPVLKGQGGPETDKLSKAATTFHFNQFVRKLNEVVGPEGRGTLVATHIDSWEGGGQNWTPAMRAEFRKRRGYDLLPYLPVLTGRVVENLQITERFLWDVRKTVSELMVENYVAEFQLLAHQNNLRLTFEAYTTAGNDLDAANYTDEPMAEFWTPTGQGADFYPTTKSMASAAHINGHSIVGAEAMTSTDKEKWLWHPAMIKKIGDDAFCQGVNRFVFHRYASQRFVGREPGMQMGPWGLHYERTNTWWDWSKPWHTYLARCQYLLRQGELVTDVLNLQSEEPLLRFQHTPIKGYDYDACGPDSFFKRLTFSNGQLHFTNGPKYRLLVVTHNGTMTVPLLTRLRDLVRQGAAIVGTPPTATPSLTNYPKADAELKKLCAELWGTGAPAAERTVGKGKVFSGITPEEALARLKVTKDVASDKEVRWIHRNLNGHDLYFLSNPTDQNLLATCDFRITGKAAELWDAETGRTLPIPANATTEKGITRLTLPFGPSGSCFVLFRKDAAAAPALQSITRNGQPVAGEAVPALNLVTGDIQQPGTYVLTTTDGKRRQVFVPALPVPVAVSGPWQVRFQEGRGAPAEVKFNELVSWHQHPEKGVNYFSGTARYTKTLPIPAALLAPGTRLYLDLGEVAVMASVTLNGQDLGILWKPPYRVDITPAAKAGDNTLQIAVVNLWPNRLIGDEQLPEDSERKPNGTLQAWPQWLLDGQPSPTGRLTFSSWRLWKKADTLQESGLLGPVTLQSVGKL